MTAAMRTMTLALTLALLGAFAAAGAWAHHLIAARQARPLPASPAVGLNAGPELTSDAAEEHAAVLDDRVAQWQAARKAVLDAEAAAEAAKEAQAARAAAAAAQTAAAAAPAARAPRAAPAAPAQPAAQPQSITGIITAAFAPLGGNAVSWALRVAACESGDNPNAANRSSGASGLFQFLSSTWALTPYAASSIFDPVANAKAAAWLYVRSGPGNWQCG